VGYANGHELNYPSRKHAAACIATDAHGSKENRDPASRRNLSDDQRAMLVFPVDNWSAGRFFFLTAARSR